MVTINLLPWRKQARRYQIIKLIRMFVLTFMTPLLGLGILHWHLSSVLVSMDRDIDGLQHDIRLLSADKSIRGFNKHRMDISTLPAGLLRKQRELELLFHALSVRKEQRVCLTGLARQPNGVLISGMTSSADELLQFFHRITDLSWASVIKLDKLQRKTSGGQFIFQAQVLDSVSEMQNEHTV